MERGNGVERGTTEIRDDTYEIEVHYSWYRIPSTHWDPPESDWTVEDIKLEKNGVKVEYDDLPKDVQARLDVSIAKLISGGIRKFRTEYEI